jgi:diacylglycerol kinase family enzyme
VRALLIVNPRATTTTRLVVDILVRSLAAKVEFETVSTRYRGHARDLAASTVADGYHAVLALGGDGTINEVVNGLMREASAAGLDGGTGRTAARLPALAAIPGGNSNVFARSLGLPADPVAAAGRVITALTAERTRTIGLGMADDRYFTFSAGLGLDAEVVRAVEAMRARGRRSSTPLFVRTALRQYFGVTDRRRPALTLERDDQPDIAGLFMGIIANTTPWTYIGRRPVSPTPDADFNSGLDVFALRRLDAVPVFSAIGQMLRRRGGPPAGRHVVSLHDEAELTLRSRRPIACQVDGEYVGEPESVTFRIVPEALRVIA